MMAMTMKMLENNYWMLVLWLCCELFCIRILILTETKASKLEYEVDPSRQLRHAEMACSTMHLSGN